MTHPIKLSYYAMAFLMPLSVIHNPARADNPAGTIVIMRHGEKPAAGLGQINCQGLQRALALPRVLMSRFGQPTALYASNPSVLKEDYGIPYAYIRPLATIEPLAIQNAMPVDIAFSMKEVAPLAEKIIKKMLETPQGTHIIAWEHHWAVRLAKEVLTQAGAHPDIIHAVPQWPNDDFDRLYVIDIKITENNTTNATFRLEQQGLNGLPKECPIPQNPEIK